MKEKQYFIILIIKRKKTQQRNKQYCHDNKVQSQEYNRNYWYLYGHKYFEERKNDINYKSHNNESVSECVQVGFLAP